MRNKDLLMDQLAAPENLLTAWRSVRGNIPQYRRQRSSGPDGVTLEEFERDLPTQLNALRHMLLKGRYTPQAPGLVTMRKRNGGTRQIAILNVVDRVAQRAAQQVIEPLYEPIFLPCSFGFRPGRSTQDAIGCARRLRQHGYAWVVDGDIAACFDSLDHRLLVGRLEQHIQDQRVIELLNTWLNAGIFEHSLPEKKPGGLAQGWETFSNKVQSGLKSGLDWTLRTNPSIPNDPYLEARYQPSSFSGSPDYVPVGTEEASGVDDTGDYQLVPDNREETRAFQQQMLRQFGSSALLLGSNWARQTLVKTGPAAIKALRSPAGQEMLKRGLVMGGGAVGAAVGVAAAGYFLYRQVGPVPVGVLQGSPLSPLLANIYLHPFDQAVTRSGYRLVRFADDWVVLCPSQASAEKAYNQTVLALAHIHLKVNAEKTHILSPQERFEWLGEIIPEMA